MRNEIEKEKVEMHIRKSGFANAGKCLRKDNDYVMGQTVVESIRQRRREEETGYESFSISKILTFSHEACSHCARRRARNLINPAESAQSASQ